MCVFGAHSGSHTHSEPRIVTIFSEFLQTDGRTDGQTDGWTDRCAQTDRERGIKEEDWKQINPTSFRCRKRKSLFLRGKQFSNDYRCSGVRWLTVKRERKRRDDMQQVSSQLHNNTSIRSYVIVPAGQLN